MARVRVLMLTIVGLIFLAAGGCGPDTVVADLIQDLRQGVRMAGKFLGIDTISDVADLVAKGFSRQGDFLKPEVNGTSQQPAESLMLMLWKLIGLDGSKLGAMVMNVLIFVAHVIATNLGGAAKQPGLDHVAKDGPPTAEESAILKSESPLDWLLNKPPAALNTVLQSVHDRNLTDYLESDLNDREQAPPEDTGCIRLLMCKIKPFIWKMQQVVTEQLGASRNSNRQAAESESIVDTVLRNVPTLDEFEANGARCEAQHKHCARKFG
ncbi:uncharacterized protein LOC129764403 [Toxorhynchites rutilus septentrionalis]|uniref:uncharacterized protein LOC129764403 n=1 Tax=Toxorhynchites rutilus septentrionalis TaxID=329112 RepID=UPI0024783794|nr:uncharacterized protein LOC129764403 [Toxorhynchites rutilus septentrionalis]